MTLLAGCGSSETEPSSATTSGGSLPTLSIGAESQQSAEPKVQVEDLEQGSPEWIVREITRLRVQPAPETNDVEKLKAFRLKRNRKVIEFATQAVALTHKDPEKERLFTVAAHHMMEARLQLALQGDRSSIDSLYDDAASFYQRDPESQAAADAAYTLASFAHSNSRRFDEKEPRWLVEFSRQACLFARNFPKDSRRAPTLLLAAGESCELHGMVEEAVNCYSILQNEFSESPLSAQVSGSLRRLKLQGQPLKLAGPTLDGGFVSVEKFKGKVVLVVFWGTQANAFVEQIPRLNQLREKYSRHELEIVGVNLDEEEPSIDAFLEKHVLDWPQIFYSDREKRGWKNPTVIYYGIKNIPTAWLVDQEGIVIDTQVSFATVDAKLKSLLTGSGKSVK